MPAADGSAAGGPLSIATGFLQRMSGRAPSGGLRLPQSWASIAGLSWTYDAALTALALSAAGDHAGAADIVAALCALQEADGALRDAYSVGSGEVASAASSTGNQAWAGLAMVALGERSAAERIADWIARRGDGNGVPGGRDAAGRWHSWKSTEHNAEVFALFRALGREADAASCLRFLRSMRLGDRLATGTLVDGVTPNPAPIPLDAQLMPALATAGGAGPGRNSGIEPARDGFEWAVEWARRHLAVTDGGITGVTYSIADDSGAGGPGPGSSGVWLEGTAQLAVLGDGIDQVWAAQRETGGIPAATRRLATGFGDTIPADQHTGTTAWTVLAALGANPLSARARTS